MTKYKVRVRGDETNDTVCEQFMYQNKNNLTHLIEARVPLV